ncbi:MAG: TetR/AcrR family transcriptional regulator [Desulfobacter sp.]|nr:TetR/AcrR family transcriptional regulator [Desulfobacter sp.]
MAVKKKYHHGDLRRQLIETALDIISEHGLEKVSMRGLGQRIGVSRTAPYRHFTDKSALLSAIAEQGYKKLTHALNNSNTQGNNDSVTRLMNVGIAYVEFAVSNPVHYRMMFGNEIRENSRPPELVSAAETAFNELLFAVKACQDDRRIKPLDPFIIANTLWSTTHGISSLLIDGQVPAINAFQALPAILHPQQNGMGNVDVRQIFELMSEILFNGLLE